MARQAAATYGARLAPPAALRLCACAEAGAVADACAGAGALLVVGLDRPDGLQVGIALRPAIGLLCPDTEVHACP